ncbi:MAG: hypothetical protein QOJ39_860 [Candidatus Eremiobacteraeota bacterium]|jgi:polyisoprenoid-binding protein YceI|nr:hypothetical protein [Candidatus Eremiobacteraeota bacterium]
MLRTGALLLCALAAALGGSPAPASADTIWSADAVRSNVALSVSNLLVMKITGAIPIASATIVTADGDTVPRSVAATLDAAALTTHDTQRDAQLRGDHFFDVARFPTITFASERVTATGPSAFAMEGELTMHGVTHAIAFDGHVADITRDASGRRHARYEVTGRFRRSDYGMSYARGMVGNDVRLDVVVEAVDAPRAR